MTIAVCMKCGSGKVGALSTCPACGFMPKTSDEGARSMWLSDLSQPPDVLQTLSEQLARGEAIAWDESAIASWREQVEQPLPPVLAAFKLGCTILVWLPFVVLAGLIGLLIYLAVAGE